ncbi:hypothetical protein [Cryobacterium sp. TMT2-15-1]|uniref:hypothetical protein n=1 Tax=Cryobacterium sp. TMT2-15-1 TaxID=1259246 RepID=UPI0018E09DBF|nr:hypothetical protein [Cryobacterium sp. TMT2-15-1]
MIAEIALPRSFTPLSDANSPPSSAALQVAQVAIDRFVDATILTQITDGRRNRIGLAKDVVQVRDEFAARAKRHRERDVFRIDFPAARWETRVHSTAGLNGAVPGRSVRNPGAAGA